MSVAFGPLKTLWELSASLSAIFWNEYVWLPPDFTWEELDPKYEYQFTNYRHLYLYPIPLAIVILLIRFSLERFCFKPLGLRLGIKDKKIQQLKNNNVLEKAYLKNSYWAENEVASLAKKVDWTVRQVYRWLRVRRNQGKPNTLTKFCENSWRCLYYASSFIYGMVILWNKPWFWDINYCWVNYPYHGITRDVWWYYIISLAFYWSLSFSQFFDNKRKDFWQMFIHHVATISLLSFSWICNLHRVGTLVLVIHDTADCILDGTKALKYLKKYDNICTILFAVFLLVWIITRLLIFPLWVLKSTTLDAPYVAKRMFPAYYIFNGLLILLMVLHILWTKVIFQLAYRTWTAGQLEGDIRSSGSSEESEVSIKSNLINKSMPMTQKIERHFSNNKKE